jgi:Holliday junction DNA helicase RuvA
MALAILSQLTPAEIALALSAEDKTAFNSVSGVGKKLSERIITELKDKFIATNEIVIGNTTSRTVLSSKSTIASDAISALVSLGINKIDAQNRVNFVLSLAPDSSINDLIKLALKNGAIE